MLATMCLAPLFRTASTVTVDSVLSLFETVTCCGLPVAISAAKAEMTLGLRSVILTPQAPVSVLVKMAHGLVPFDLS